MQMCSSDLTFWKVQGRDLSPSTSLQGGEDQAKSSECVMGLICILRCKSLCLDRTFRKLSPLLFASRGGGGGGGGLCGI